MNIAEILITKARETPQFPALIATSRGRDRVLTFADLDRLTAQAAALLHAKGLRPGHAVLVFQPMSIELYVALLAIFRLGLVAMFLDPSAGREHIERCCSIVPPRGFVGSAKAHWLRLISPSLRRIPQKFAIGCPMPGAVSWSRMEREQGRAEMESVGADAPALITFTSGSTGEPKAAVRTHGFLIAQHEVLHRSIALCPGEVDLSTLPIFVLANLASGVTSVIADANLRRPGTIDPRPVLRQIHRHRPSRMAASPAFLERLVGCCEAENQPMDSFTKIYTGGGPVFPALLERLQRCALNADVVAVYGSTEAEPIAHCSCAEIDAADWLAMQQGRGLLAGKPVPEIVVRIVPDQWGTPIPTQTQADFEQQWLAAGEAGEIVVHGAHVLQGYLHGRGDEETKMQAAGETWHRTGDAGFFDAAGRLWLVGRCAARIRDARGTLYPMPAEAVARQFSWVRQCALVGLRERRVLVLESNRPTEADQLNALRQVLLPLGVDAVRVVKRIPVDPRHNAKIDYPRLHRMLGSF